ncbi:D-methionine ABC transporter permease protein MetI [Gottschalkia acidurici 9a]|uniref:D-methionine ABC transporter permease protein MetI n=1 Tax=Gottschalkia acidurici (strain ATCC 7906 / DSM 604 / BCRC 14475 / CIP 104303 / KCTC 5404 / NCIMB 10678 / 9a) TaxID=1128398 RepID=K0AZH2_GOTA9|nr:methionine ABC transporter permease [Gottschalkia acidurici]AFS77771.1 D-methionine ABC transporter permease protein MetI [Gottschalkia acidurici 9a]
MDSLLELLLPSLWETLYMVSVSTIVSVLLGLPLGILLIITEKDGLWEKPILNSILGTVVNISRSFPFLILMILLFPLARLIVGTTIGTTATIVPLSIAAAPFVARVIESSLREVDGGIVEAALAMGSTNLEIIFKVLIPEAMPSIVSNITLTIINLIGYSAMAGTIGGGGLGDLAMRYGYHRFDPNIMAASVILIIVLVQVVQFIGNQVVFAINKRR